MRDTLQRFLFEHQSIRGEIVHLNNSYRTILAQHPYPTPLKNFLGQMLGASVLLAATLKTEEPLTLQIKGQGPLSLLVVQADNAIHVRGMAQWKTAAEELTWQEAVGPNGVLAMLSERADKKYQAIVPLQGDSLAQCIETYFYQSEQLPTKLCLFNDEQQCTGLLLQVMPDYDPQYWKHIEMLANTLTAEELLQLDNETILRRLFHQEAVRLFDPTPASFQCRCSLPNMEVAIRALGMNDAMALVNREKLLAVTCEFCNQTYEFDPIDVEALFR